MSWEVRDGDARDQLRKMPERSVQCAVTSPPFWGLRDYDVPPTGWADGWEGCLGLEPTPEMYVAHLVEVFAEVRRVLRDDGVLWLNLGDSYTSSGRDRYDFDPKLPNRMLDQRPPVPAGLKQKDLVGIPWRVAFALQADGWYLRSEVIWHKPNALPESVGDRPTKAHEQVFLLTKSPRYFYDADAIREPHEMAPQRRPAGRPEDMTPRPGQPKQTWPTAARDEVGVDGHPAGRNKRSVWSLITQPFPGAHFAVFPPALVEPMVLAGTSPYACEDCRAPWRRVEDGWQPMCACGAPIEVHPLDLEVIESPLGHRAEPDPTLQTGRAGFNRPRDLNGGARPITRFEQRAYAKQLRVLEHWQVQRCLEQAGVEAWNHYIRFDHSGARPVPRDLLEAWIGDGLLERVPPPDPWWDPSRTTRCLVLDPFCGSGTTGLVAARHDRDFVGLELNAEYAELARDRIRDDAPLWNADAEGDIAAEGHSTPWEALSLALSPDPDAQDV